MDWPKYSRCFPKESSVLSNRSVDSQQKNRRFFLKEATILFKRSDDAKRKQSIYFQKSLNCYAVGDSNTGQIHSKIIVFPLGFREAFSLCCISVYGFIQSNTMKLGGLGKDTCFFDEMQYPYEDSCKFLSHSWHRKGSASHILQLPQCRNRVIQYNPQSILNEPFVTIRNKPPFT